MFDVLMVIVFMFVVPVTAVLLSDYGHYQKSKRRYRMQ